MTICTFLMDRRYIYLMNLFIQYFVDPIEIIWLLELPFHCQYAAISIMSIINVGYIFLFCQDFQEY